MIKADYLTINSKIHALESYLLKNNDYEELSQRNSVPDIARYLRDNTVYASLLKNIEPERIHRRDLEVIIKRRLLRVMFSLINYFHNQKRTFAILLLKRFEIENLKYSIRNALIEGKKSKEEIEEKLYNLGKYSSVDFIKIISAKSTDELLTVIENTSYYEVIKNAISIQSGSHENLIHLIENALDTHYETKLQKEAESLGKKEYEIIMDYIGTRIDLKNLEWIIRAKMFYELSAEQLYNSLIRVRKNLHFDYLRMACDTKNAQEAIDFFAKGPYGSIFTELSEKDLPFELSRRIDRYFFRFVCSKKIENEFNIGKLMEYLYFLEYESEDLIRLIEAIRYSIDTEKIPDYLIRELDI